tara:strand:+ start:2237 stop:3475 length:1239 start_codon:yes stop_codon:yes gene_type:complete
MKKKIFVIGPVLSQSGYGEQSRFALRALRSKEDIFDIYIQPINWGETGWKWEDNEFRRWMDERIAITAQSVAEKVLQPDISLQITIPNEFKKIAPINLGYTAGIETNRVAPIWLEKGNEMDKILVVSEHAKTTYVETVATAENTQTGEEFPYRLEVPVEVVHERTQKAEPEEIPNFELKNNFNFLIVSQMGPRKNMENAIRWWVEEFIDQKVGLVVKTAFKGSSQIDREFTQKYFKKLLESYPNRKCTVSILHGDLTDGQMAWLYRHEKIKSIVNIAHGEGFGLPLFEAAEAALPIITIPWGGQQDFLIHGGKEYFQPVEFTVQPIQQEAVWDGVLDKTSMWAFAEQGSYKMSLRKIKKSWKSAKKRAEKLKDIVEEKFSKEKLYENFCNAIYEPSDEELSWAQQLSKIEIL